MRALLMDCETTGLLLNMTVAEAHRPRMLEFYGAVMDFVDGSMQVVEELDTLVKPVYQIDEAGKAAEVTGITNAMLADAPRIEEVMPRVRDIVERSPMVIAHNASFDREIVDIEADRLKMNIAWPRLICTVEQTQHLKGHRLSLGDLHDLLLGERFSGAHRARADVMALARCVSEMIRRDML